MEVRPSKSPRHKDVYVWVMGAKQAEGILTLCLPYLVIKKRQAELFIEAGTLKYPTEHRDYQQRREEILNEIRQLNATGMDGGEHGPT